MNKLDHSSFLIKFIFTKSNLNAITQFAKHAQICTSQFSSYYCCSFTARFRCSFFVYGCLDLLVLGMLSCLRGWRFRCSWRQLQRRVSRCIVIWRHKRQSALGCYWLGVGAYHFILSFGKLLFQLAKMQVLEVVVGHEAFDLLEHLHFARITKVARLVLNDLLNCILLVFEYINGNMWI